MIVTLDNIELNEDLKNEKIQKLVANVIHNIVFQYSSQSKGMSLEERKVYYTLSDKLDEAITESLVVIDLDDNEARLLKKWFRDVKTSPSNLLRKIEDNLEKMVDKQ